ncbi:MAG: hypothetical protein IJ233_02285, partial [Pyramidobacter sp.]|nr:hypothetical protein [Pyramidobacter sp.]
GLTAKAAKNNFDAEAPFMSAVLIADLDNHAAAGVGKNAKISAGRDIKITPSTQNTISTNATASAPARSPGGTALNATLVTTGASAAVSSDLTAGGSVTISGFDYTDSWTAKAVTKASISPELNAPGIVKQLMTPTYKAFYKKLADKIGIPENMRYGNGTKEADYSTEWGFAALYTGKDIFHGSPATQTAAVTIAPGVKIASHAFIDITSAAQVIDHQWITTSSVGGHEKTAGDTVDTYAFALNYDNAEMDSTASVGRNAQLNADGKIDVSSLTNVEWHRAESTVADLKSDWQKFLQDVTADKARELWKQAYDKLASDEFHDTGLSNSEGFKNYAKAMGGFIKGAYIALNEEWGAFKDLLTLATDPLSFLDFSSYANVYAGSSAKTINEEQKQKSGGGTFAYPRWHLNNLVDIASGAKLISTTQIKVTGSTQSDMSFIGGWSDSLQSLLTTETKGSAVGGTILVGTFDTQDEVRIHKGALLQSGKDVSIATEDSSMLLVANIASAKAGGYGWQGQLNVLDGTVAGRTRVDDEATLAGTSIDIISTAENYSTNVAAAIQRAADSAVGVSLAIDSLTYQNVARVADFDSVFSDDTSPLAGASIAADTLTVEAVGNHRVNTIAASGVVSRQEQQGELQIGEGLQNLLDYPLNIAKKLGTKIGNKIQPAAQPAPNPAADPAADPLEVSIN